MQISPSKSRDMADENSKILKEWKWFETTVLKYTSVTSLDVDLGKWKTAIYFVKLVRKRIKQICSGLLEKQPLTLFPVYYDNFSNQDS
jgi:hypothetical protein